MGSSLRLSERQKSLLLLACVTFAMLGVAELALRFARPQPTYSRLLSQVGSYYVPSEYNTFQLRGGYAGVEPSMESPGSLVRVTVNPDGFRGPPLDPGREKILVMGDSYTFGVYVEDDETYPAVLERLVRERHPNYQVVNAGFTDGWDTDQHYVWLGHNLDRLRPRVVILGVFLGNDIGNINPSAWSEVDADGLPRKWLDRNLEVTPQGFIRDRSARATTTAAVEAIYRVPVLRESHLLVLASRAFDRIFRRSSAERFGDESFQHIFGIYTPEFLDREALFLRLVEGMKRMCEARGARFLVALLPINFMVEPEKIDKVVPGSRFRGREAVYYGRLQPLLERRGIVAMNVEAEMKRAGEGPYFPANGEVHFNPRGNAFTARRLYEHLLAADYLR